MDTTTGILVFTEHPQSGSILAAVLRKLGFSRIFVSASPTEAVKTLATGGTGLVVVDHAPGSSQSVWLIKALRDAERFRALPLLILAEPGEKGLTAFAAKDPHCVFVAKPLAAKAFAAGVVELLSGRPGEQRTAAPRQAAAAPAGMPGSAKGGPAGSPTGSIDGLDPAHAGVADIARLIQEERPADAAALAEAMLEKDGPRPEICLGLALARQILGDAAAAMAAVHMVTPADADAPAPAAEKPESDRKLHGVWSTLPPAERRQKAFEHFTPTHDKRSAFRLFVPDWGLGIAGQAARLQVVDLSFGGICFEAPRPPLERGATLTADVYQGQEKVLGGVSLTVLRVESEVVGCKFGELDRRQETLLNQKLREEQTKGAPATSDTDRTGKGEKKVIKLSF
ncbi:type IV pilus assembly PilZ [Desulfovibrio sp. X2]|uniref:PilZ domain-containing protein n=1 Tax=Desulfovibrio sp. X2 TaxID=941449 RepID=UPI000358DDF9|nr:PilZ domain-containing protein [Desulfovibrio sp. X2]EPR37581.1 type IV pilus assembly PilZ [Desulfovibrio sp. X2]